MACILSHLTAIRQAYLDGAPVAMVIEDDLSPELMYVEEEEEKEEWVGELVYCLGLLPSFHP